MSNEQQLNNFVTECSLRSSDATRLPLSVLAALMDAVGPETMQAAIYSAKKLETEQNERDARRHEQNRIRLGAAS